MRTQNNINLDRKLTTLDMEVLTAQFLNPRINLIVPNISWGFLVHECDLLCVTKGHYLWEIEIKVTKADLIRDKKKYHGHLDNRIKRLYFAIPDYLENEIRHIPERAGVIIADTRHERLRCRMLRRPKENSGYKISDEEYTKLAHLAAMRIWGLKLKLQKAMFFIQGNI